MSSLRDAPDAEPYTLEDKLPPGWWLCRYCGGENAPGLDDESCCDCGEEDHRPKPGDPGWHECRVCGGDGYLGVGNCSACGGSGRVKDGS